MKQVDWKGPALSTVFLRCTRATRCATSSSTTSLLADAGVGRQGGGPLTEQKLQELMDYITTFQLTPSRPRPESPASSTR
ncbi:MAG: hypothetical protein R2711_11955 [Acidimicrobiales bacterium]